GRGLFLFTASENHPEINYLGMEIDYKEGRRGARRLKKQERPNARVIGCDAKKAFTEFVEPGSVSAIHVYFPDPWWKAKHHKRRLFTPEFTQQVYSALKEGGLLHCWTDVFDYWTMMTGHIVEHGGFEELDPPSEREAQHHMDYHTSFERKKRLAGWPIYRGRYRKRSIPQT
ncbi:MAG: tRNA (guanine-N7)-methyltransferase, partial [Planctomycetaceae bacterium]|nr:tRNA (guanine-N7)-methyltransferase [Planctomycetaceae bacterium]